MVSFFKKKNFWFVLIVCSHHPFKRPRPLSSWSRSFSWLWVKREVWRIEFVRLTEPFWPTLKLWQMNMQHGWACNKQFKVDVALLKGCCSSDIEVGHVTTLWNHSARALGEGVGNLSKHNQHKPSLVILLLNLGSGQHILSSALWKQNQPIPTKFYLVRSIC